MQTEQTQYTIGKMLHFNNMHVVGSLLDRSYNAHG